MVAAAAIVVVGRGSGSHGSSDRGGGDSHCQGDGDSGGRFCLFWV